MMSQTGEKIIKTHIVPNISRSKSNQTIKFGQLMKCSGEIFFSLEIMHKIGVGRLAQDLFLFFEKALYKVIASGQHLSFNIIR